MADNVVIEGLDRLNAKLRNLESGIQEDFAREVAHPTGYDLERIAKKLAPVDTGNLRADIHYDPDRMEVRSGDTVAYAVPVHNGWRSGDGFTHAGNPYLKNASMTVQRRYTRRLTKFASKIERGAAA